MRKELHPRKQWLTASEAARHAGYSLWTIWKWGTDGKVLVRTNENRSRGKDRTPGILYRRIDIEKRMRIID